MTRVPFGIFDLIPFIGEGKIGLIYVGCIYLYS